MTGTWVPAPFCPTAKQRMETDPDATYTYGILRREG